MRVQDYYAITPDGEPLMPPKGVVFVDGAAVRGLVEGFSSLERLLDSAELLLACVGFADEPDAHIVAFDADPSETRALDDTEAEATRPLSVRSTTPVRDFLGQVRNDPALSERADRLLGKIQISLSDPEPAPMSPDEEFSRDLYEEDPELLELHLLSPVDADPMERSPGPYVDGRELPSGYREAFFADHELLVSQALELAVVAESLGDAMRVVRVHAEDDMICVPEEIDPEEPRRVYVRPVEILGETPLPSWVEAQRPTAAPSIEQRDYLLKLLASDPPADAR